MNTPQTMRKANVLGLLRIGSKGKWVRILLGLIVAIVLGIFMIWPVVRILGYASLQEWVHVLRTERWFEALRNSIMMAVLGGISATLLAIAYAFATVRLKTRGKKWLYNIALLPILSPPFVISISYVLLFGRNGIITSKLLNINLNIYGWKGLWLVETLTFFPLAYLTLSNVLSAIPGSLEQAASNMGASPTQVFRDVTLPLLRPGLVASILLVGISILADFGNPVIIAGDFMVLPTLAYMKITGWYDMRAASVLATLLLLPTVLLFQLQRMWLGKRSYVTVSGKASSQMHPPTPRWLNATAKGLSYAAALVVAVVYAVLVLGAFSRAWGYDYSLTVRNFVQLGKRLDSLVHSIEYSFFAALLSVAMAAILGYLVTRKHVPFPGVFDFFATVPAAIPGIFLGLGYVASFNRPPLRLTGSPSIIVLALAVWNLPTAYRYVMASLSQLSDQLESASANLGAGPVKTMWKITLPLLREALLSGSTVCFLRNVTCLSVIVFLVTPTTRMAATDVMALVEGGEWGLAATLSVILLAIALVLLSVMQSILRRSGKEIRL